MSIHSLRSQCRPDNARNQVRAGQTLARRLYLLALCFGIGWIGYLFIGPLLVVDADGLVVQDREVVAPPFSAQVVSLAVKPGETVAARAPIGLVVSTQMLDLISDLSTRRAQLDSRAQQIAARLSAIVATQPVADRRARASEAAQATIDRALSGGFTTNVRAAEATRDRYDSAREAESLRSERIALESERAAILPNRARIDSALSRAQGTYRDGVVFSPVAGTVGARVVDAGVVLSSSDKIAEVFHGTKYVLAYIPTNRWYSIMPGQKVVVTDGVNREAGRVARIETITDQAPVEFQSNSRGIDRGQVARIAFDDESQFPLLSKIKVTAPYAPTNLIDKARRSVAQALSGAGVAMAAQARTLRAAVGG